ncbi:hypothetical protein BaRGS_00014425 [Batillaria attramentaria]|uniref:Uncharacterized protein n=1 Tax=Batillaria attramentaria TaxID=370345 RepID=A0ABD0L5I1_9CAEN
MRHHPAANPGMAKGNKITLSEEFLQSSVARCIIQQNSQLALLSLSQGENPHIRCSLTGRSLPHLISMEASPMTEVRYVPLVYVLSNAGVDLDKPDNDGTTPLQLAIRCGLLEIMTALLKCGAEVQGDEEELAERHGGLFFSEFTFKVNVLVKSWCRVNVSRHGQTLIEYAKRHATDPKLIKHLVDNEASIEFAHATIAGDAERMKYLKCNGAVDFATKDYSHKENFFQPFSPLTLYGAALKYGHKHLLDMLRDARDVGKDEENVETEGMKPSGQWGDPGRKFYVMFIECVSQWRSRRKGCQSPDMQLKPQLTESGRLHTDNLVVYLKWTASDAVEQVVINAD